MILPLFFIEQIDLLGRKIISIFSYTRNVLMMIYLSFRSAVFDQAQGLRTVFSVVSAQIYFTGWQGLPLITVLAISSGSIVIIQSSMQLSLLGGADMIGDLLILIILREVAPLLTALIVIARSGTAVASEIGAMKVNKEIDALESMGINPLSYIVFPRLLGGVISVICLAFYFVLIAFLGGYVVTKLILDIPFGFYLNSLANAFESADVFLFFLKNTFSGLIIFIVCSYQGLSVKYSPTEVPQATIKAVVNSIIYVIVFNISVTILFYLNQLLKLGVI